MNIKINFRFCLLIFSGSKSEIRNIRFPRTTSNKTPIWQILRLLSAKLTSELGFNKLQILNGSLAAGLGHHVIRLSRQSRHVVKDSVQTICCLLFWPGSIYLSGKKLLVINHNVRASKISTIWWEFTLWIDVEECQKCV